MKVQKTEIRLPARAQIVQSGAGGPGHGGVKGMKFFSAKVLDGR
jgi:hypothetical protein